MKFCSEMLVHIYIIHILPRNLAFFYNEQQVEIVNKLRYLGITFTVGGSFSETQITLAGQAQKGIFQLNKYLYKYLYT